MAQALPVRSRTVEIIDSGEGEYPPAGNVPWLAWTNAAGEKADEYRSQVFEAHTWIDARRLAAREFGVLFETVDAVETRKLVACWVVTFEASLGRVA